MSLFRCARILGTHLDHPDRNGRGQTRNGSTAMSEQATEATETATEANTEQQATEQPKPSETVDFWKQKAREQEKRAKENAEAAKRLAEIEESQKSDAEKSAERIKQLETEASAARSDALRFKVASKFGIGDEDADLFLTGSDEETLTKQAERLAGRSDERKKKGNYVPREGQTSSNKSDPKREFLREISGAD